MKLRELLNRAVKPILNERFGDLALSVPEFDDDENEESSDAVDELGSLSGLGLVIEYENSKGEKSQRVITCRQLSVEAEKHYLKAYCHHRKALRTFRLDRVVDIFDPTTGESLSPVQAFFAQYSPDKVTRSGLSWGMSVGRRADLIAVLNALVFLARCDREFHPSEMSCLEKALTNFWIRLEVPGDPDFDDILAYSRRLSPDGETFWLALHRFKEDSILESVFRRHAQMLIEADGVIREEEAYWSLEIDQFFSE
ncbi:WYL domain-containing protein [Erythrobacter litoralis]|uniref:WYL domain-containing protein n=1 Tax=Erythrobacter litoralis (strain HTCC2594) TaxID=314225 RepID=Q2N9V5_ERYLH|nr:WYL domain-containing protein [Erythrobacter litoralis]ABC63536.1 hypothetical protein ELI_07220 [Erythrobacter litoralis HTCC2594]